MSNGPIRSASAVARRRSGEIVRASSDGGTLVGARDSRAGGKRFGEALRSSMIVRVPRRLAARTVGADKSDGVSPSMAAPTVAASAIVFTCRAGMNSAGPTE